MKKKDARSINHIEKENIRLRAIDAYKKGEKQKDIAKILGVTRQAVGTWVKKYKINGPKSLKAKPKGRPKSIPLKNWEAANIKKSLIKKCPDQIGLPFSLWTRAAVQELILQRHNRKYSLKTIGRILKRWGLTPQKPIKKAYEQDKDKVEEWIKHVYPEIKKQAIKEKATIFWGDEMGIRSDDQVGRTYGLKGTTPTVTVTGKRFKVNMISAISNLGKLNFMLFEEKFTADVFIKFSKRLINQASRKVFIIIDNHPVHKSKKATNWYDSNSHKIKKFYLPPYAPEINPDENLNQDVKSNAVRNKRSKTPQELKSNVRRYLYSRQRTPKIVQNYFCKDSVKFARH